jgi:ATP-dependent DNA helicase RecG
MKITDLLKQPEGRRLEFKETLSGKDIKVAIYDDMIEITSPGKLLPSIDYNELEARQSDIKNKVIAPVFKN